MKKFLSFALALAMTASLVPATAFAATDARVNKVITAEADDDFYTGTGDTKEANYLILQADGNFKETTQEFEVKLENAEWYENAAGKTMIDGYGHDTVSASSTATGVTASMQAKYDEAVADKKVAEAEVAKLAADNAGYLAQYNTVKGLEDTYNEKVELATAALKTWNDAKVAVQELEVAFNSAVAARDAELKYQSETEYTTAKTDAGVAAVGEKSNAVNAADADKIIAEPQKADKLDTGVYAYYINGGTNVVGTTAEKDLLEAEFDKVNFDKDVALWVKYDAAVKKQDAAKKIVKDSDDRLTDAIEKITSTEKALNDKKTDLSYDTLETAYDNAISVQNAALTPYTSAKKILDSMTAPAGYDAAVKAVADADARIAKYKAEIDNAGSVVDGNAHFVITRKSASTVIVTVEGIVAKDDELHIPLWTNLTGGNATVSVDAKNSEFTSETKTFAKTVDGATVFTTEGVKNFYDGEALKDFFVEEVTPGTFEAGKKVTVRVSGGFEFEKNKGKITVIAGDLATRNTEIPYTYDKDEIFFNMPAKSTTISQIKFAGFELDEDGADYGDEAELTISGAGIDRETIKVGTYSDFGITMEAEDKELPVIYAGTKADSDNDNTTLKVVIEETVANSFIANRKVELTLPEGVEFSNVNEGIDDSGSSFKVSNFKDSKGTVQGEFDLNSDGDKITINGMPAASGDSKKRKVEVVFDISAAADFTGDVDLKLSGPGVANEELTTTIATVKAPIEVKADVNELKLDYRNTEASDITLVEPAAGVWEKDDKIILEVEEMQFESGIKAEVVSGDIKLKKLDGDYVDVNKKDGTITIEVDSKSGKTPAEIKISGVKLYMDRNLPAGDYKLNVYGDKNNETFINNYDAKGDDDMPNFFDTDSITAMDDYIKVVTAGRDQDDATFTTKITVPVGADKIMAGTKEIALDAPAYINKDGYTMLPVRAVTEALNGVAAIKWDNDTKTATINFGQRVFSMTVNSKVMNINGVQTNVLAAPEIKNDRIFLPLRDLGYALGLTDSKIAWDSATSTATLN